MYFDPAKGVDVGKARRNNRKRTAPTLFRVLAELYHRASALFNDVQEPLRRMKATHLAKCVSFAAYGRRIALLE
jgi:hypothetical protein